MFGAEQPLGPPHEDDGNQREHECVPVAGDAAGQRDLEEDFERAEDKPAKYRSTEGAETAQDCGDESFEDRAEPHKRIDHTSPCNDEDGRKAGEEAGYCKSRHDHLVGIDAHHANHVEVPRGSPHGDRKSTRLNSSHVKISYAVFCLKKKKQITNIEASQT